MLRQEVLERARRCLQHGVIYHLGAGGMHPESEFPWGPDNTLDCSGFVAWCLGVSRRTDNPWYKQQNGGWIETSAIVRDTRTPYGIFSAISDVEARPGDLVVYGDAGGAQGHVGIIWAQGSERQVVHCSKGNYAREKDAIQVTSDLPWRAHNGITVRCALIED